jgi:hypothetical protein
VPRQASGWVFKAITHLGVITVRLLLFARSVCLKQYSQGFNLGVELTSRMINTLDKLTPFIHGNFYTVSWLDAALRTFLLRSATIRFYLSRNVSIVFPCTSIRLVMIPNWLPGLPATRLVYSVPDTLLFVTQIQSSFPSSRNPPYSNLPNSPNWFYLDFENLSLAETFNFCKVFFFYNSFIYTISLVQTISTLM